MRLQKYSSKRNLKESPEPKAKVAKGKKGKLAFVVQKHAATRLHYDFRLELDGVLLSWAVPKGPSLDPSVKRLAVKVEDHPFDYRNFEGIIPRGYGAGTVMIWDQGTFTIDDESRKAAQEHLREGIKKGAIHFTLEGEKLKGRFSLVKMKDKESDWLLIKSKDAFASKKEILKQDRSVASDKTLEEIREKTKKKSIKPHEVHPMLCTLVDKPFDSKDWLFEIKLDGFRAIAELDKNKVEFYSRNLQSFQGRFPELTRELKKLNLDAILDGEIVALDKKGISHFQMLQNYATEENIFYFVFDILYLNGKDLRGLPLIERKEILKSVLKSNSHIRYLDHIEGEGERFFQACKKMGLEGIIGKKKESHYEIGLRSREWLKIKAELRQEVVICGFTEPKGSRKNFGALIVGVYKKGDLHYAGRVGGGFTEKKLDEVKKLLLPIKIEQSPLINSPRPNTAVTWVKPQILCEVKFKEWTKAGSMRQPIFIGIRTDKPAKSVVEEKPIKVKTQYDFITHPDKLYWEKEKITKGDLLHYYERVAPFILPYLKNRPITLKRYPDGALGPSFYQKNIENPPEWLDTVEIEHTDRSMRYMVIQNVKSLLYAVNLGSIEIHPWFSRTSHLQNPDFLIFDLDPVEIAFDAVVETALALHDLLDSLDVPNYCKTSGGRGMHIGVPLKARYSYDQAKQFAVLIATFIYKELPKITSLVRNPKNRKKKVYIDCYQNNFGQTLAAPYSVRAKPGAPVSTPLDWSEVKKGIDPSHYTLFNTLERVRKRGDIFKPILSKGVDLKKVLKKISS